MKSKSQSRFVPSSHRRSLGAWLLTLLLAWPQALLAQVGPGTGPVPVPEPGFFFLSPGGSRTATGFLLSFIEIALAIAGIVAVLFLIVGGFRYITASGNEEQAEAAKKTITHVILGVVIIILSFVIIRVIANALIFGRLGA